jgi:hypothetical protein
VRRRAERLPGFVQANPPKYTYSATTLPLATEARQYFIKGEPEIADLYFPWLVDLMSPAYWVYLVMAVTIPVQRVKSDQPVSALAGRRRTREAREAAQGVH